MLYDPRSTRGLALFNVELYNIEFEISKLAKHWASYGTHPEWTEIEEENTAPFKPTEILSQNDVSGMMGNESFPIYKHSIEVRTTLEYPNRQNN